MKVFINKRIPETGIETLEETGLDVTNPELISAEDLILGLSATVEARNGLVRLVAGNIIAFSKNKKMPNCANSDVYSDYSA